MGFFEWVWVEYPLYNGGRGGGNSMACQTPWDATLFSSYIRWVELLFQGCSFHDSLVGPFSLFPLIRYTSCGVGEALLKLFRHQHHHAIVMLECSCGFSPSAAPLEWGNIVHRQAVRVNMYGSAAPCGACLSHDLEIGKWSATWTMRNVLVNTLSLRGWVHLHFCVFVVATVVEGTPRQCPPIGA
jgi:hypothetical protein